MGADSVTALVGMSVGETTVAPGAWVETATVGKGVGAGVDLTQAERIKIRKKDEGMLCRNENAGRCWLSIVEKKLNTKARSHKAFCGFEPGCQIYTLKKAYSDDESHWRRLGVSASVAVGSMIC